MTFRIEDTVCLKTDTERLPRLICKYEVSKSGVCYYLMCGAVGSWHYDFEMEPHENKPQIGLKK